MTDVDYSKPLDNLKYETFCRKYVEKFNGTDAAIAAGYSKKTARSKASQLLTIVNIQERNRYLCSQDLRRVDISKERILQRLADIAFGGLSNFGTVQPDGTLLINLKDCPAHLIDTISQYEVETVSLLDANKKKTGEIATKVKLKPSNDLKALEMLGKFQKMWTDVVEVVDVTDRDAKILAARQRAKDNRDDD